jgi:ribonuclease-3
VSRSNLAKVAMRLKLAPLIQLGRGEEMAGGRQRAALLADCMESFIGAIYLDGGWETARAFVVSVFEEEFSRADMSDRFWDYKSRLQVHCQAELKTLPVFRVIRESGPDHKKEFEIEVLIGGEIMGSGVGLSKKEAEQMAARGALYRLGVHLG